MAWNLFSPYAQQWWNGQPITPVPGGDRVTQAARMLPFQILSGLDKMTQAGPGGFGTYLSSEMDKSLGYATAPATGPVPTPMPATAPAPTPARTAPQPLKPFSQGWSLTSTPGDPRDGGARVHKGWDFAPTAGDPNIRAPLPFEVIGTSKSKLGGNIATVRFDDGNTYKLMHLAALPPTGYKGDAGSVIATAGRTGNATGTTVHVQPVDGAPNPTQLFGGGGGGTGPNLSAFQQAANQVGLTTPPPQFDPSGYQQANSLLQQVQANATKPFSTEYERTPAPEFPEPTPLEAPDYTKSDAAFTAAQPKNPFGATPEEQAAGQLKMRRSDYFAGMAQALASIDWSRGVGLGELFAKVGAGALMGAKAGDAEVQSKVESFDRAMQQYNLALANREENKATTIRNVLNRNIEQLNAHKDRQAQINFQQWQNDQPRVENGVLITKTPVTGPDGKTIIKETHTPVDPARASAALFAQANNAIAYGNAKNDAAFQQYRFDREMAGASLGYAMADAQASGNLQGRDGIAAFSLAEAANALVEAGSWQQLYDKLISPEDGVRTKQAAYAAAGMSPQDIQMNKAPTEAQQKIINNYLSQQIIADFTNAGKSWALVGGPAHNPKLGAMQMNPDQSVITSLFSQRERERKVTRTTDYRGRQTVTERQ